MALTDAERSMCWHAARGLDTELTPEDVNVLIAKIGDLGADLAAARAEVEQMRATGDKLADAVVMQVTPYSYDTLWWKCLPCGGAWRDDKPERHAEGCLLNAWRALTRPERGSGDRQP